MDEVRQHKCTYCGGRFRCRGAVLACPKCSRSHPCCLLCPKVEPQPRPLFVVNL